MKLGVLLDNIGSSQLAYCFVRNGNRWLANKPTDDIIGFYSNQVMPCLPIQFSIMQMSEAWGYNGNLLATDLLTATKMLRFPSAKSRLFYVWDMEWLRAHTRKSYRGMEQIYRNPALKLLARSEEHKNIIEDCWNTKVTAVVGDFEMEKVFACLS